jgi:hypothetical protein
MAITTASGLADQTVIAITAAQDAVSTAMTNLDNVLAGYTFSSYLNPISGGLAANTYDGLANLSDTTFSSALEAFDDAIAAIALGTLPSSIGSLSTYATTPKWTNSYWTTLKTLLTDFTGDITGSDDVDSVVTKLTDETTQMQVALYAAEVERKQQALRDAISAANSSTGARGFTFPTSMTTALHLKAQQDYMFGLSQASRDLVKLIFEWAKNNYQFSVGEQVKASSADMEFNIKYAETLLKQYVEETQSIISKYKAELEGIIAKINKVVGDYKARIDLGHAKHEALSLNDKAKIDAMGVRVQEVALTFPAQVHQTTTLAVQKIEAAGAAVTAAASLAQAANQTAIGILNT